MSKSIKDLTTDSCVFLTGVTGFVGGCLLERICSLEPGPARLFVLVREKRGIDPRSRVEKIFSSPLFSGIPARKLERIQVVSGDVGSDEPNLGIGESDLRLIIESCTHVYHVAAFISFAAQLDHAVRINLRGTREVLRLASKIEKLRAMVHVSTAYVNCTIGNEYAEIHERIYPLDVDPAEFLDEINSKSGQTITDKYGEFIGKYPNTYTFTKQLTENLLAREKGKVPLSIVRPGIILNSWREPFPGWVDNVNSGACGFIAGAGKGVFCTFQACNKMTMDAIPVDLVVSTILAAALKAENEPNRLHVFHCTSGTVNPITWGSYCEEVIKAARKNPCLDAAWYPRARLRESRLRNYLVIFIFQIIPAFFIDLLAGFSKTGHVLIDIQRRYAKGIKYTSYFSMHEWRFTRDATDELSLMLPEDERLSHPMDPRLVDWKDYFENCVVGTRTYFHKEPAKTTDKARRQMAILRVIAELMPALSFTVLCCCLKFLTGISWLLAASVAAFPILLLIWL